MTIKIYSVSSENYKQELKLRNKVLRKPLGMNLFDEDLSQDALDIHMGVFEKDILIGCILTSPLENNVLKMRQVAIDNEFQGKGVGSRLVKFCEEFAIKKGYKVITMHARKTAMPFYIKLGYTVEGDEFTEVSIPHYEMIKNLQ